MPLEFEKTEGVDYVVAVKSKLTDDLTANHEFLTHFYNDRKQFVDAHYDQVMEILKTGVIPEKERGLVEKVYHYINQEFALLYWLREGYLMEQAKFLDKHRDGDTVNYKPLFDFILEGTLDTINKKSFYLDELLEGCKGWQDDSIHNN